ncbi:MAG: hypothetical protein KA270_20150 [Saprospiraceae bacterium]|jgi:hypothetical protein|nr:hypothetical protein [Saprospiraceae bacterium]
MKWFSQVLVWIYSLTALYFLYTAAIGIFVYFANKSMGHYESFLMPGRNLAFGLILGAFAFGGWKLMKNEDTYKIGMIVTYFPFISGVLFMLWFVLIFATNGGKWN